MLSQDAFFTPPHHKADLLERVSGSWVVLQQTIAGLSPEQLTQVRDHVGWSIQDHLLHLSFWEEALVAMVKGQPFYESFGLSRSRYQQMENADQLNAILHQRVRDYRWSDALERCQRSHQQVVELLSALPETEWQKPISFFQPGDDDSRPILTKIIGDTYRHYAEHWPWIEAIIPPKR